MTVTVPAASEGWLTNSAVPVSRERTGGSTNRSLPSSQTPLAMVSIPMVRTKGTGGERNAEWRSADTFMLDVDSLAAVSPGVRSTHDRVQLVYTVAGPQRRNDRITSVPETGVLPLIMNPAPLSRMRNEPAMIPSSLDGSLPISSSTRGIEWSVLATAAIFTSRGRRSIGTAH